MFQFIFKSHRGGRKMRQGDRLTHCWCGLYPSSNLIYMHHIAWLPFLLVLIPVDCSCTLFQSSSDHHCIPFFSNYLFYSVVIVKTRCCKCIYIKYLSPTPYSSSVGLCLTGRQPGQVAAWNLCRRDSSAHWLISLRSHLHPSFHSVKQFFFSPEVLSGLTFHLLTVSFSHVM